MSCHFIGLCALSPEAQAAWAQAVFSVAAIIVAIWVPWNDGRARERLAREKRKRRASVIRQLLITNLETAVSVADQLAAHYRVELGMNLEHVESFRRESIEDLMHQGNLYTIWNWHEDELHLLDPHAMQLTLQVIRKAEIYRATHMMAVTGSEPERERRFKASISKLVTLLDEIRDAASRANLILRRDQEAHDRSAAP